MAMSEGLPPMQWEDVLCSIDADRDAVFNIILSALVLENGGSATASVVTLRELRAKKKDCSLTAEVVYGQLLVSLVDKDDVIK